MKQAQALDYAAVVARAPAGSDLAAFLAAELPWLWLDAYVAMTPHAVNVQRLTGGDGHEYLFDFVDQLIQTGDVAAVDAAPDRLVAVHGRSRGPETERDAARMRHFPLGAAVAEEASDVSLCDRGHMIAHGSGGGLDINLVPQLRSLNQGRSDEGSRYRAMERYCADHPGTYCFSRLIYTTLTDHPRWIEFGVLEHGGALRVERFSNVRSDAEMAAIERVFRARAEVDGASGA
ncbi:MAG: DNA/RNA non-specific endonuclease [Planctomycetes bacterium]|nr:DNA/RNA non-specific endonuclease [Planctomycetota bacterium]